MTTHLTDDGHQAAILAACAAIGYGRVMQMASQAWCRRDPLGALTVGPCVGTVVEKHSEAFSLQCAVAHGEMAVYYLTDEPIFGDDLERSKYGLRHRVDAAVQEAKEAWHFACHLSSDTIETELARPVECVTRTRSHSSRDGRRRYPRSV